MLNDILRVRNEPFSYVSEQEVYNILTSKPFDYLLHIESKLKQIATGVATIEMPTKKVFIDKQTDGDFRVMPCVLRTPEGTWKTVKIVGTNLAQTVINDQITVGKVFCLHPQDNFITHIVEACLLSSARTGACAILAMKILTKKYDHIVIVGCGRVGYFCALYALALGQVLSITFVDKVADRAEQMQIKFKKSHPKVNFYISSSQGMVSTDVLIIATDSRKPLYEPGQVTAKLVISVGADNHIQRELSPLWSKTLSTIFVDSIEAQQFGDLRHWQNLGMGYKLKIVDLLSLFRIQKLPQVSPPLVFISTGIALFDNLTLSYLVEKYSQRNIDNELDPYLSKISVAI